MSDDAAYRFLMEKVSGSTQEQREHDAVSQLVALTNRELAQPQSKDERAVQFLADATLKELRRNER